MTLRINNEINSSYLKFIKKNSHLAASLLIILISIIIIQFDFFFLEGLFFDFIVRISPKNNSSNNIAIIAYDDQSYEEFPDNSKIPAKQLATTIKILSTLNPKLIAVISPGFNLYSKNELKEIELSIKDTIPLFWGHFENENILSTNKAIKYYPGIISKDIYNFGKDEIVRRVLISINEKQTIYSKIAKYLGVENFKNTYSMSGFLSTEFAYIQWRDFNQINTTPLINILNNKFNKNEFKNKVILIGRHISTDKANYVYTPFSRHSLKTPLIEVAAISINTLINNNGLLKTSNLFNTIFAILVGLLTVNVSIASSYSVGLLTTIITFLVPFLFAFILQFFNVWFLVAHSLILIIMGRILSFPFQIIEHNQKKWQYEKENELLTKIEKIKSNFLSLMSHDFKTPLAKIESNVETILMNSSSLNESNKKTLLNIIDTISYLNQYIDKAIDLAKAENSSIPIVKTTKDINVVIEEVIKICEELAKEKRVVLSKNLSPMFSFKFDYQLIKKVIYNLIENAIKYSNIGGTVTVKSSEEKEFALISISDNGMGIPENEKSYIFDKFYRGKHLFSKGVGLGLYLSKYFVELHNGKIEVTSEQGKGSSFTVFLPLTERNSYGQNSYC